MPFENKSIQSSLLPDYSKEAMTSLRSEKLKPTTQQGLQIAEFAEKIRSSSEPPGFIFICLAAATRPEIVHGKALMLTHANGERFVASDPEKGTLCPVHTEPFTKGSHDVAEIQIDDDRYLARVNDTFIAVEGEDAFYKAIISAVKQCNDETVTNDEIENLRFGLADIIEQGADELWQRWRSWYEGHDSQHPEPEKEIWFDAPETSEKAVSLTEDCKRCLKQLLSHYGEVKESELFLSGLAKILPMLPLEIVMTAQHLYSAVKERKNLDLAILSSLTLASSWLAKGNILASTAHFIRHNISDYLETEGADSPANDQFFTALALLAIAGRHYWRNSNPLPQRSLLQIPIYLERILHRASLYWNQLGRMSLNAPAECKMSIDDATLYQCVSDPTYKHRYKRDLWTCENVPRTALTEECPAQLAPEELHQTQTEGFLHVVRRPATTASAEAQGEEPIEIPPAASHGRKQTYIEMTPLMAPVAVTVGAQLPAVINKNRWMPGAGSIIGAVSVVGAASGLGWGLYKYFTKGAKSVAQPDSPDRRNHDIYYGSALPQALSQTLIRPQPHAIAQQMLKQGMRSQAVQRSIVDPLTDEINNSLEGFGLTGEEKKQRRQQALSLAMSVLRPTLTMEECRDLYQGSGEKPLDERFTASEGYLYVTVNGQSLRLWSLDDDTPYVIDRGKLRFIRFNQIGKLWEYVDENFNTGYAAANRENREQYRTAISPLSHISIDNIRNRATVKTAAGKNITGVFIAGDFIPAWGSIEDEVIYTDTKAQPRVLVRSDYGWEFERASSPMDDYVKLMFAAQERYISNPAKEHIGATDIDGVSMNRDADFYVKSNYLYYPTVSLAINTYSLWHDIKTTIEYREGLFKLKNSTGILRSLQNKEEATALGTFRIETEALNYIMENAERTNFSSGFMVAHGLYKDPRSYDVVAFDVNNARFKVKYFGDNRIHLERTDKTQSSPLILQLEGDTWIRVRNEKQQPKYKYKSIYSYYTMQPEDTRPSYTYVKTEERLHRLLQKTIDENKTSNLEPIIDSLIKKDKFTLPVLWENKKNNSTWFLYKGRFFPTTFIDAADSGNPGGLHSLQIFSQGDLLNIAKPLAAIVLEKKGNYVEIKTQQTALSEMFHISEREASLLIENRPWRGFPGIAAVEEAVSEARVTTGRIKATLPVEVVERKRRPADTSRQRQLAIAKLYPPRVTRKQLEFFRLTVDKTTLNEGEQNVQKTAVNVIKFIKEDILNFLEDSLHHNHQHWTTIRDHLNKALNINSHEYLSDFIDTWRQCLKKGDENLKRHSIYLIHGRSANLTDAEKSSGNIVYMSDYDHKIYINMDKAGDEKDAQIRLITELMHIMIQATGITRDIVNIRKTNGTYIPFNNALEEICASLRENKIPPEQLKKLQEVSKTYLQSIPAYRTSVDALLASENLAYILKNDPSFRAWIIRYSAPWITQLSLDTFYILASTRSNARLAEAWTKSYGELRGELTTTTLTPSSTSEAASPQQPPNSTITSDSAASNAVHKKGVKLFRDDLPESEPDLEQERRRGETYIPGAHDKVFLPDQDADFRGQESRVVVPGYGKVTSIVISGLECLGEKDLTFSEELRNIGKSLQKPFIENSLAWQEIYHLDFKHKDCPSPEDANWLAERADVLDTIFTTLMMIPKFWPVFFLQTLVGPFLQQLADDLEGRDVKTSERIGLYLNAILQAMTFARIGAPTLKGSQRLKALPAPYIKGRVPEIPARTPSEVPAETPEQIFTKRFKSYKSGREIIEVDGIEYPLFITEDEQNLMVSDAKGRYRFVRFNQWNEKWEITERTIDDTYSTLNQEKHRILLTELSNDATIQLGEHDLFTIKIPGKPDITGVFIDIEFIPAQLQFMGDDIFAYTTTESVPYQDQRILTRNQYGWEFEAKSANMDNNLAILLSKDYVSYTDIANDAIGPMKDTNGISFDSNGRTYIKHNNKYYKTERLGTNRYRLTGYDNSAILYQNGYFKLEAADDVILTFKNAKVKDGTFLIESAAQDHLNKYAATLTTELPHSLGKGVYEDNSHLQTGLLIDNTQFVVTKFSNNELHIQYKSEFDKPNDIKLWSSNKVWYLSRERAEETPIEYVQCRPARAPGLGTFCLRSDVRPEKNLHRLLKRASGDVPAPGDLEVTRKFTIPYLYQSKSTQEYYFRYNKKYFHAEIMDEDNSNNPTGYPCIKVKSGSDFYNSKATITTIVSVHDENPIKLVDMPTFISNRLGGSIDEAVEHIKNAPYIGMQDIDSLESLTTDTRLSGKLFVEMPNESGIPREAIQPLSEADLQDAAKNSLFSADVVKNGDYTITFYDLTPPPKTSDPYLSEALMSVNNIINHLEQRMLPSVLDSLRPDDFNNPLVEDYIKEVLDNNSPVFIADVEASLYQRADSILKGLRKRKIKLVSTISKSQNKRVQYTRTTDRVVFSHPNNDEYLFINIDMLDIGDNGKYVTFHDLNAAIIKELAKSTVMASPIIDLPMENGIYINIKDAYSHLQDTIESGKLPAEYAKNIDTLVYRYLKNSPTYASHADLFTDIAKNGKKFRYIFENDPAFRFHCIANSDDFIPLLIEDLYYWGEANTQDSVRLHSWLKKYGIQRGMIVTKPKIDTSTDATVSSIMEVHALDKYTPAKGADIYTVEGKNNLYLTEDDKILFYYDHEYYELNFIGRSGRVVILGAEQDLRQVYNYNPDSGELTPVLDGVGFYNTIEYYSSLDLYQLNTPGTEVSEVYKYDTVTNKLVPTGAQRIIPMPGQVTRIEFPDFNIYHLPNASPDLYVQGYGQILNSLYTVPANMKVTFYAAKGRNLNLYRNSMEHLLEGRLPKREISFPKESVDDYNIWSFNSMSQSYYHLASKYNKNVIQITSDSTTSERLLQGVSNIFPDKRVELHLFMGRSSGEIHRPTKWLESDAAESNPSTSQQHITGSSIPPGSITQFVPLPTNINYLSRASLDIIEKQIFDGKYEQSPYDVFRGLDTTSEQGKKAPPYIVETRQQLTSALTDTTSTLEQGFMKLHDPEYEDAIDQYLSHAVDNTDKNIVDQVRTRLQEVSSRVHGLIKESQAKNYENFVIVSSKLTKDPAKPDVYKSNVNFGDDNEVAFAIQGDRSNTIYIVNDQFFNIKSAPEHERAEVARLQVDTIIHEHSHLAVSSIDAAYTLDDSTIAKDPQNIFNKIKNIVETKGIEGNDIADKFMGRLYRHLKIDPLDGPAANQLIKDNPALMTNIVLENADTLSWYLLDIAKLEPTGNAPRAKRAAGNETLFFSEPLFKIFVATSLTNIS